MSLTVVCGNLNDGLSAVGEGRDTGGLEWLIACADKMDERPLWISSETSSYRRLIVHVLSQTIE